MTTSLSITRNKYNLLIAQLQNSLHGLLETFLGLGSTTPLSLIRRPNNHKYRLGKRAAGLVGILERLDCDDKKVNNAWKKVEHNSRSCSAILLAGAIAEGYRYLDYHKNEFSALKKQDFPGTLNDYEKWWKKVRSQEVYKPLLSLCEDLRHNGKSFGIQEAWIHGSLGTIDDISGYSDFDALVLLDSEQCTEVERLLKLQEYLSEVSVNLCLYDPLQHHGFFVITETDLCAYPEAYFPLELYRYAIPVFGNKSLSSITVRDDTFERKHAFLSGYRTIKFLAKSGFRQSAAYDIKAFLQTVVLMPALYLQLKDGMYRFKKYSFAEAREDFSKEEWDVIDKVTTLRKEWKYNSLLSYNARKALGRVTNPKLLSTFHRLESIIDCNKVKKIMGSEYEKGSILLIEAMIRKLREGNHLDEQDV